MDRVAQYLALGVATPTPFVRELEDFLNGYSERQWVFGHSDVKPALIAFEFGISDLGQIGFAMAFEVNRSLATYMAAVQRQPKLTREQEQVLWHRWRVERDARANDALVRANLRYVLSIAFKYRHYHLPISELIAEGNIGILHAMTKFEPERGLRFVTYAAYWIRAFILKYITQSWSLVGGGSGGLHPKIFFKLRRERARTYNVVGDKELAERLLAERFNVQQPQLAAMLRQLEVRDASLTSHAFEESSASPTHHLTSPDASQEELYSLSLHASRSRTLVKSALEQLDQRERYVIERRVMADKEDELSLAELGQLLGISRERVRQIEARALKKLRTRAFATTNGLSLATLFADTST